MDATHLTNERMDNFRSTDLATSGNTRSKIVTPKPLIAKEVPIAPIGMETKDYQEMVKIIKQIERETTSNPVEVKCYDVAKEASSVAVNKEVVFANAQDILQSPSPSRLGFGVGKQVATAQIDSDVERSTCVKFNEPDLVPGPCDATNNTKELYFAKEGLVCNNTRIRGYSKISDDANMADFPIESETPDGIDNREMLDFSIVIEPVLNWWLFWYNVLIAICFYSNTISLIIEIIYPVGVVVVLGYFMVYFNGYVTLTWIHYDLYVQEILKSVIFVLVMEFFIRPWLKYNILRYYLDKIIIYILELRDNKGVGLTRQMRRQNFLDSVNDLYINVKSEKTVFTHSEVMQRDPEASLIPYIQANLPISKYVVTYNNGFGERRVNLLCCNAIAQWVVAEYASRDAFKASAYRAITQRVKRFTIAAGYVAEVVKGTYTIANYFHLKQFSLHASISPLN